MTRIAFIGMEGAGSALIAGWGIGTRADITAHDRKTDDPEIRDALLARVAGLGITGCDILAETLGEADLVTSVVSADLAVAAAPAAAPHLKRGAFFCDCNSCAPSSKQASAGAIEAAGGRCVDVAVMAPVHPAPNKVPLSVSGPHVTEVAPVLEAAGVADEVMPTLKISFPTFDRDTQAADDFERAMVHDVRRATGMPKTLTDLGLPNGVTRAAVDWETGLAATPFTPPTDLAETDAMTLAAALPPHIHAAV